MFSKYVILNFGVLTREIIYGKSKNQHNLNVNSLKERQYIKEFYMYSYDTQYCQPFNFFNFY